MPGRSRRTSGPSGCTWRPRAFSDDPGDRRVLHEGTARSGAVVLGRHLFDVVDGPNGWDDTTGYGAGEVGKPAFVAAERDLDIDRDVPDLRRLPVIR